MCFDGFPEAEGAWVDDNDEWCWRSKDTKPVPEVQPVPGAWLPGLYAGPVEKVFLRRAIDESNTEFYVKWKGLVRHARTHAPHLG